MGGNRSTGLGPPTNDAHPHKASNWGSPLAYPILLINTVQSHSPIQFRLELWARLTCGLNFEEVAFGKGRKLTHGRDECGLKNYPVCEQRVSTMWWNMNGTDLLKAACGRGLVSGKIPRSAGRCRFGKASLWVGKIRWGSRGRRTFIYCECLWGCSTFFRSVERLIDICICRIVVRPHYDSTDCGLELLN